MQKQAPKKNPKLPTKDEEKLFAGRTTKERTYLPQ